MTARTGFETIVCVKTDESAPRIESVVDMSRYRWCLVDLDEIGESDIGSQPDCVVIATDSAERLRAAIGRVRDEWGPVPIVVASETADERLAATAVRTGVTEYVPSAVDEAELAARICAIVDADEGDSTGQNEDRVTTEHLRDDGFDESAYSAIRMEAYVIAEDGRCLAAWAHPRNDAADEPDPAALVDSPLDETAPATVAEPLCRSVESALETNDPQTVSYAREYEDYSRRFEGEVYPIAEPVGDRRAAVILSREVSGPTVRVQQDSFETLNQIYAVARQVVRILVEAPSRSQIEREVCEKLVETDLYAAAWIGERSGETAVSYRTGTGEAPAYLDVVKDPDFEFECKDVLESVLRDGESTVTNELAQAPTVSEDVKRAAIEDGLYSAIVLPLGHNGVTYGLLVVAATRPDAFGEHERSTFGMLAETIGFAINAIKNRRLLFADTIVELDLRIEDGDSVALDLTDEYDCRSRLEWAGRTSDGLIHQYVTIEGLRAETALEYVETHDSVDQCRLIRDDEDACTLEVRLEESGIRTLTNLGARVLEAEAVDGTATLTVEVPWDTDVRRLVDAVRSVYDETTLIARREVDRDVPTGIDRHDRIVENLTDRQETALRLAYYGGYFDWPRGSTGEELADAMDVSPPTMHQHLRRALQTLLDEFFENDTDS